MNIEQQISDAVDAIVEKIEYDVGERAENLGVPVDDFIERISTELRARLIDG